MNLNTKPNEYYMLIVKEKVFSKQEIEACILLTVLLECFKVIVLLEYIDLF